MCPSTAGDEVVNTGGVTRNVKWLKVQVKQICPCVIFSFKHSNKSTNKQQTHFWTLNDGWKKCTGYLFRHVDHFQYVLHRHLR